jgi:hypothetical protein
MMNMSVKTDAQIETEKFQIDEILRPFRNQGMTAGSFCNGVYWEVWLGNHGGGREDGVGLAKELADKIGPAKPPKPAPVFVEVSDPAQAARIAELEAMLAEAQARPVFEQHGEPEPVVMPKWPATRFEIYAREIRRARR